MTDSMLASVYEAACEARERAYAPYSKFLVGAAVLLTSGKIFSGHNIENASYGATVCAERTAIWKAVSEESVGLRDIACLVLVTDTQPAAPPCGQCLQVMAEFMKPDTPVHLANLQGIERSLTLAELLPESFSFS